MRIRANLPIRFCVVYIPLSVPRARENSGSSDGVDVGSRNDAELDALGHVFHAEEKDSQAADGLHHDFEKQLR